MVAALALAGLLNLSLVVVAATSLHGMPGTGVAILFAVALLGSGFASTAVGSAAGAEVTAGLLHRRVPLLLRRTLTVIPAIAVPAAGVEPIYALVVSQGMLSMGIPFALIPLVVLTSRRGVLGSFVNHPLTTLAASVVAVCVISLNIILLYLTFTE